jgi:hypothetical protein
MINKTYRGRLDIEQNGDFILYQEDNSVVNITQMLSQFYLAERLVYLKVSKGSYIEFEEDGKIFKKLDQDGIISNFICGNNLDYCLWYLTDDIVEIEIRERSKDKDF